MASVKELTAEAKNLGIRTAGLRKAELETAIAKERERRRPAIGRPTVLTRDVLDLYVSTRYRGGTDTDCAYVAGIHPDTVRKWRQRYAACDPKLDEAGELQYLDDEQQPPIPLLFELFEADKKAIAEARLVRLNRISRAGADGTWQADAWWLERKYQDEFSLRGPQVNVTAAAGVRMETSGEVDPDEETVDGRNKLDALVAIAVEVVGLNPREEADDA